MKGLVLLQGPTIAAGEDLSNALDVTSGVVVALTVPPDWFSANLTFQLSADGNVFSDVVDHKATILQIPVRAGSMLVLTSEASQMLNAAGFLKIRSGSPDHPVVQPADVQFAVTVNTAPNLAEIERG